LWANRLRYDAISVGEALADFTAARVANLRMIARMTPADLQRSGLHAEWGEVTVRYMLEMEAGHDLLHLRQIERIRRAVEGGA
jgi:phosphoglycolate phosphatase-like HAD superfamily hydrolase